MKTKAWLETRGLVILRDDHICQMCKKLFSNLELTVHHIIPRKSGGKDVMKNLITLCNACHDIAEIEELNKKDIINYLNNKEKLIMEKQKGLKWQQWVYGGFRRPY